VPNRAGQGKAGGRTIPLHPDLQAALVTLQMRAGRSWGEGTHSGTRACPMPPPCDSGAASPGAAPCHACWVLRRAPPHPSPRCVPLPRDRRRLAPLGLTRAAAGDAGAAPGGPGAWPARPGVRAHRGHQVLACHRRSDLAPVPPVAPGGRGGTLLQPPAPPPAPACWRALARGRGAGPRGRGGAGAARGEPPRLDEATAAREPARGPRLRPARGQPFQRARGAGVKP
jgi:hypothetical protein